MELVNLSTFAEARLAEALIAGAGAGSAQPLVLWRATRAVHALPRALRVSLVLRVLRTLRARDRWESSWTRALRHPACPPPRADAVFDRQELWGMPGDDWLCAHCGQPLFALKPYRPRGAPRRRRCLRA